MSEQLYKLKKGTKQDPPIAIPIKERNTPNYSLKVNLKPISISYFKTVVKHL
jgi:hypothetical protein